MKLFRFIPFLFLMVSCTATQRSKVTAIGADAYIKCFSGGKVVYIGMSKGMVEQENTGSGYNWSERTTGRYLRSNADCVVSYEDEDAAAAAKAKSTTAAEGY